MKKTKEGIRKTRLVEGIVNTEDEHIRIYYENSPDPFALVSPLSPLKDQTFLVQYLVTAKGNEKLQKQLEKVKGDIVFFLIEKDEENPWAYAKYHCGTGANFYSKVHWAWFPKGYKGKEGYRSKRIGEYILKPDL